MYIFVGARYVQPAPLRPRSKRLKKVSVKGASMERLDKSLPSSTIGLQIFSRNFEHISTFAVIWAPESCGVLLTRLQVYLLFWFMWL